MRYPSLFLWVVGLIIVAAVFARSLTFHVVSRSAPLSVSASSVPTKLSMLSKLVATKTGVGAEMICTALRGPRKLLAFAVTVKVDAVWPLNRV